MVQQVPLQNRMKIKRSSWIQVKDKGGKKGEQEGSESIEEEEAVEIYMEEVSQ